MALAGAADSADLVLVGAGLQNALVALAVLRERPNARVVLLEASSTPLGNHTWCFHAADVPNEAAALVEPLVVARWPEHEVRFPGYARRISDPYSAITSDRLRAVLLERLGECPNAELRTNCRAIAIDAHTVTLADGARLQARLVVDARGPDQAPFATGGFQKFVGLELGLRAPSPLFQPLLMDATVPQTDGLRFFYALPLDARRVLVEDTYFSDTPNLDVPHLRAEIGRYAEARGLHVESVVREESGVLPLPVRTMPFSCTAPLVAGYGGGFFHPATGYSFPAAIRLALHVAKHPDDPLGDSFQALLSRHRTQFRFGAFLNRLMFGAFRPEDRWNALARFYRLPEDVIRRFYALETTPSDRLRILCGRPPRRFSLPTLISRGALA